MLIESVRVSKQARDQLITLKRRTGIENWNVLCRWALCVSLAESSPPRDQKIVANSSLEMSWRTFGGESEDIYEALIRQRCQQDGFEASDEVVANQFRLHLHRGIAYLAGEKDIDSLARFIRKAI